LTGKSVPIIAVRRPRKPPGGRDSPGEPAASPITGGSALVCAAVPVKVRKTRGPIMTSSRGAIAAAVLVLLASAASAAEPGKIKGLDPLKALAALGDNSTDALAGVLRHVLIESLPSPPYEDDRHWGAQKEIHTLGGKTRLKNDGDWWKVKVTADHLPDTLVLDLRDVRQPEPGKLLFTTFVSFDADVDYDKQEWKRGVRLYSGELRARMRVKLTLHCEVTARVENEGKVLPETVFRLRVADADFKYDNLVVEHVGGVGGEAAKLLGDAALGGMHQWHPSFERALLAKADAAIVKAADTKEVRIGLSRLFGNK
jgi:hypothetical protein